jgi:hypothetical protein
VRITVRALSVAALLPALLLTAGCGRQPPGDSPPNAPKHLAPAERGRLRAQADIAAGKPRIFRYGNPVAFDNPRTDPESGLPVRTLFDCCITAQAREETEAYNSAMRSAARDRHGGQPPSPGR